MAYRDLNRARKVSKPLLVAAVFLLFAMPSPLVADSVRNRIHQRTDELAVLEQYGLVVEQDDGYLRTHSADPEILQLVRDENEARRKNFAATVHRICTEKWPQNYRMRQQCERDMLQKQ